MSDMLDPSTPQSSAEQGKPDTALDDAQLAARWKMEIERYERKAEQFLRRGRKINDRYTAEKKDENAKTTTFNIFWSNLETLKPALYARDPTVEVERRFKDEDPVGRVASDVLERCGAYMLSKSAFGDTMRQVVKDRLIPGRGVAWVRYLPHLKKVEDKEVQSNVRTDGPEVSSTAPEDVEEVTWEEVKFDFVPWTDFGHQVARTWQECDAVWRIAFLDKLEVRKRFGVDVANALTYEQKPEGLDRDQEGADALDKAKIYEVWDKRTKRVIWINKAHPKPLDVTPAVVKLENFWPLPEPLQATTSSGSFIPTADYVQWQDQAAELDRLSHRITMLTRAIKVVGVYDASTPALQSLLNSGVDNRLVAVDSWAAYAERGGLKGSLELMDVDSIAKVLLSLYDARDKVKQDIYEISGLSDLLRGASDPETTATAEKLKAGFASVRLKSMQREVQNFARELVRIGCQIICSEFDVETIKKMSCVNLLTQAEKEALKAQQQAVQNYQHQAQMLQQQHQPAPPAQPGQPPQPQQPPPNPALVLGPPPPPPDPKKLALMSQPSWDEVMALLQDEPARGFRIDIETDSTVASDEQQEQESRMAFADTVGKLMEGAMQVVKEVPQLAPAMAETVMMVLRSFKVGRSTESAFQRAMDKLSAMGDQPAPPKPDPEQIKAQGAIQLQQAKLQGDMQLQQAKVAAEKEIEQVKAQAAIQIEQATQAAQTKQMQMQQEGDAKLELLKQQHAMQLAQLQAQGAGHQHAFDHAGRGHDAQIAALQQQHAQAMSAAQQDHERQLAAATDDFNRWKAQLDAETKVLVARIGAETSLKTAQMGADAKASAPAEDEDDEGGADVASAISTAIAGFNDAIAELRRPRTVQRGPDGKMIGLQ